MWGVVVVPLVILVLTLVLEAIEAHLDRVRLRAFPQRHPEPGHRQGPAARWLKGVSSLLIGAGILLVILGLLAGTGALSWFGHLPGDIRVTTENTRIFVPITSMLVVSLVLNVLAWAFLWLFRH